MQSDHKSQLITICMLIGALATIGLALTGTLQMRVSRSPIERGMMVHDVGEAEM